MRNLLLNTVEVDGSSIKVFLKIYWITGLSISLGGAGHIKLSKELHSADANYWIRSGTTEWRIDYVGGTNAEEAEELEIETELSLEPMKFFISGASDDQVKSTLCLQNIKCAFSLMECIYGHWERSRIVDSGNIKTEIFLCTKEVQDNTSCQHHWVAKPPIIGRLVSHIIWFIWWCNDDVISFSVKIRSRKKANGKWITKLEWLVTKLLNWKLNPIFLLNYLVTKSKLCGLFRVGLHRRTSFIYSAVHFKIFLLVHRPNTSMSLKFTSVVIFIQD